MNLEKALYVSLLLSAILLMAFVGSIIFFNRLFKMLNQEQQSEMEKSFALFDNITKAHRLSIINSSIRASARQNTKKLASTTYYLPFPDKDGFFWDKDLLEQLDPVYSAYEVSPMPNDATKAHFRFLTDSKKVNTAIQNFDICLEPVCEIVNFDDNGIGIRHVRGPGEIYLDGDKWRTVPGKKLKIEII